MLSKEFKLLVGAVESSTIKLDGSSKELFILLHSEFLKVSHEDLKSARKDVNQYLKDTIVSDMVRSGITRVVNTAYNYSTYKSITHLDTITYDNIKNMITLLKYIESEHDEATLKSVRGKLSRVKGVENYMYNNNFRTKLSELKKEYKVVVTDEGEVVKLTGNKVLHIVANNIDSLSPAQRDELLALLSV